MDLNPDVVRTRFAEFALANIHRILSLGVYKVADLVQAIQVCFVIDWPP